MFFAPVAAVLIGVAFTAHRLIAPAVTRDRDRRLVFTWLSARRSSASARRPPPGGCGGVAHCLACVIGVAALAYIALTRDHLLDS